MFKFNFRKVFIVDKEFQYPFIVKNVLLLFVTFFLIFAVFAVWENNQAKQGFLLRPPSNAQVMQWAETNNVTPDSADFARQFLVQAKVYTMFDLVWKPLLIVLVLNIMILIFTNIYYSHKIAGPLHRLKKVLRKKLDGESIYPFSFRKNDPFHDLADLMNKVLFGENYKENKDEDKKRG